jgi:hypothetical protein
MPGEIGWAPAIFTIKRRRDRTPKGSIPELRFREPAGCDSEIGEVDEVEEAALLPVAPTLRSDKLDRPVKYRFFRRSNFLAIRATISTKLREIHHVR